MTIKRKSDQSEPLDRETLELLGSAPAIPAIAVRDPERQARLRERVMARVDEEVGKTPAYITIREQDGPWTQIAPLIEKKVLNVDQESGLESYLLRLQPGAAPEQHHHDEDELCIVLEGDVSFDDVHLEAGDFHYARKGTSHGIASTVHGAIIFLQSVIPPAHAMA